MNTSPTAPESVASADKVAPRSKSFLDRLARNLVSPEYLPAPEPAPEPKTEPEAVVAKPSDAPTAVAAPPAPAPEKPVEKPAEPVVAVAEKTVPAPAPKKPVLKPVVKDEDFQPAPTATPSPKPGVASLAEVLGYEPAETVRDYLENLRWAEGRDDRNTFKGLFAKEVERLKRLKEFNDRWRAENPDAKDEDLDPRTAQLADGTTYRGAVGRAALSAEQQRRLEMDRVRVEARESADQAGEKVRQESRRSLLELEVKPRVEQRIAAFDAQVVDGMTLHEEPEVNAELGKLVREGGVEKIAEDFPIEAQIVREELARAKEQAAALMKIKAGLVEYNPDNRTHAEVSEFVYREAEFFEANGGEARVRDGKSFLTPSKFAQLKPEARERYWTFSEDEMVRMMQHRARANCEARMTTHREAIQKRLAARDKYRPAPAVVAPVPAAPAPTGAAEPARTASPVVRPSPTGHAGAPQVKPVNRLIENLLPGYTGN